MTDTGALTKGMTFDEVCRTLKGWRYQAESAVMSVDKLHLFNIWDFTPPAATHARPLRITFDNGKLLMWGEPAAFDGSIIAPQSA